MPTLIQADGGLRVEIDEQASLACDDQSWGITGSPWEFSVSHDPSSQDECFQAMLNG